MSSSVQNNSEVTSWYRAENLARLNRLSRTRLSSHGSVARKHETRGHNNPLLPRMTGTQVLASNSLLSASKSNDEKHLESA